MYYSLALSLACAQQLQGNKGATAVRMTLYKSNLITFVNSHLAAFDDFTEKRNSDYHELVRRIGFVPDISGGSETQAQVAGPEKVFQTDVLFWLVSRFTFLCWLAAQ